MSILSGLLNLVYPPLCSICGRKLSADVDVGARRAVPLLCHGCLTGIKRNAPPYCKKCGRSLRGVADSVDCCWECAGRDFYFDRSWSCVIYEGAAKEALHLLKYSKKFSLTGLFCNIVLQFIKGNPEILKGVGAVAAVPLYSVKFREREFNQAHLLAKAVASEFNIRDNSGCLKRKVFTKPQSGLNKRQRADNVKGTFEVTEPHLVRGKNLLIVDDLFTTGATLNECSRVLKKANVGKIHCLTFARGV